MREIKFRAWDEVNSVMEYNVGIIDGTCVKQGYQWFSKENTVSKSEPMQYTGLKDKNGVEIYEGDIVKWAKHSVGVVEEVQGCWSIRKKKRVFKLFGYLDEVEVIGNIYENEELLK